MEEQDEIDSEKLDNADEKPKEFESRIPKRTQERIRKDAVKVG